MLIVFFLIVFLFVVLTFVWPPDSPWSPWWRTNKKIAKVACSLAQVSNKDIVYELGSGDGEFCIVAVKEFDAKKAVGIEIDYSRHLFSKLRQFFDNVEKVEFVRKDFKKVRLNEASVVYFYLVPRVIDRIMPKLKRELKKGTRIISYKYKLPMKELKKKNEVYLYQI